MRLVPLITLAVLALIAGAFWVHVALGSAFLGAVVFTVFRAVCGPLAAYAWFSRSDKEEEES